MHENLLAAAVQPPRRFIAKLKAIGVTRPVSTSCPEIADADVVLPVADDSGQSMHL